MVYYQMPLRIFAILATLLLSLPACKEHSNTNQGSNNNNYKLPAELFLNALAERGPEAEIYISGTTNLPDGMTLGVEIPDIKWKETVRDRRGLTHTMTIWSQDLKIKIQSGRFRSTGMMAGKQPYPPGKHKVELLSIFNGAWQSKDILNIIGGEGGKNLKGSLFRKTDPDVIDSDLELSKSVVLVFPPLSPESQAIELVKKAVLTVPDHGRSATSIGDNVAWFIKMPGLSAGKGWMAKLKDGQTYLVTFDYVENGTRRSEAVWSADLATKKVQYINSNAKIFSWTPSNLSTQ